MRKRTSRTKFSAACLALMAITFFAPPALALDISAGTAKAVITPQDHQTNHRVSVMGGELKGVKKDIYARVLTLSDGEARLVIVTYDLNCLDVATPILRSRCKHELGIDPACLVLLATHNHSAPIQIVPDNFDYGRWLADRIFALIKDAVENEAGPVKVYFGTGSAPIVRGDPRYPGIYGWRGRLVDDEVQLMKVTRGDKTVALLFNQPTHIMQSTFSRIEPGHPGYAMDEIEQRSPGTLAMYADACGGDQTTRKPFFVIGPPWRVRSIGKKLADSVMDISRGPMEEVTGPLASSLEVIPLSLAQPLSYEAAWQLVEKRHVPLDIGLVPYPHPDRETNWIRMLLMHYDQGIPFPEKTIDRVCTDDAFLVRELPEPREFPCIYEETIVARIGPMTLVAMQGEVCSPIGVRIKNEFKGEMPLMVFAYMGEHNLYIPTRKLVENEAYQSRVIQIQYASPVGWTENVEDEMVEGVVRMINSFRERP